MRTPRHAPSRAPTQASGLASTRPAVLRRFYHVKVTATATVTAMAIVTAMATTTAMAMFNGPRACQAARTRTTGQATSKERVIFALRRLQHPLGARAHARLQLQPSIHTNTLVRLRCGAKMRATAIQVTTTHEGIYEHLGITVRSLMMVGRGPD